MWATMMSYQLTLDSILERAGKLFREVEIISRRGDGSLHRYTYADFYRRTRALAEALQLAGLRRGERVGTLMWNHHAHLESYFGVPAAGGVAHTLNVRLHPNDLAYIINHAEDRFLIVDSALLPIVEQFRERIQVQRIIVVAMPGDSVPKGYTEYETFLAQAGGRFSYPSLHENEGAVLCYTSGTAGSPKGIVYSHRALVLHSLAMALPDNASVSEREVVLPIVPMYHANAWGLPLAATMLGCKQVFAGPHMDASGLIDLFASQKVTLSAAVPTIWLDVLHELEKNSRGRKLGPMRGVVSGAAPPVSLIRALDKHGISLIQAWGLIETAPLATFSSIAPRLQQAGEAERYAIRAKQGRPLPFMDFRALGENGPVPWDGTTLGEAQLRGPWVASSYYNQPDLRIKWTEDGWFRTGDVVTIDANGYVKITDRAKDLIRYGDDWISSVDLENQLMGHPAVKEAAVIAVQHPKWQERPLAAIVLKPDEHATADDLRSFLGEKFATWQLPEAFVFLPQLPHTATGKLLKKELRKQFKNYRWEESPARP